MGRARREARRRRRDEHRAGNRRKRLENVTYERVVSISSLDEAAKGAARNVAWKTGTQRYLYRRLLNAGRQHTLLTQGKTFIGPRHRFDVLERGKLRHITSSEFRERVIQKSLARRALIPAYTPSYTKGNSANMKGRGTDYAIRRLKRQLARHHRRYGDKGWILLTDYSDYFGSIRRGVVYRQACERIPDPGIRWMIHQLLETEPATGIGLGSEPNQQFAVSYPTRIDHWLEEKSGVEYTGRYMDDMYCISPDKTILHHALETIQAMSRELGLTLNPRKTHIVRLSHGFTWLKKKWTITQTGRIIIRPGRKAITRERRKLKRLARLASQGVIPTEAFQTSYTSWRGGLDRLDAHRTQHHMDHLYQRLLSTIEDRKDTP